MLREKAIEKSLKWRRPGTPITLRLREKRRAHANKHTVCDTGLSSGISKSEKSTRAKRRQVSKILITLYHHFGSDKLEVSRTRSL